MTPQPPYCSRVGCPNQPTHAAGGNRWCRKHLPLDESLMPISWEEHVEPDPDAVRKTNEIVTEVIRSADKAAQYGYREGHVAGANAVATILTDLIAEQRELHHRFDDHCSLCNTGEWPCQCVQSLDRAEQRLREVSGIETVVNVGGKYYRAIVPHPEDWTIERPILAIWPDELTEEEAERFLEVQGE